jgi:5S rRNA maturation endonuclease (ribonuclease M5)
MTRDEIIAANPLAAYLRGRGFPLYPAGPNFVTHKCPVAEHRTFHRCVTIDTGKNLFHCNDCDKGGSVIDWIALEEDLTAAEAMRKFGGGRNGSTPEWKIVATYDYTNERGRLLFQCVRCEPKKFKQRRPDGSGGWIWDLKDTPRVLYRLREILTAETVCITEGEKDADNLRELGFTATTNPMGALKWKDEYSESLRGKIVLVFGDVGDPDKKGEQHTAQVIQSLTGKAKSVRHIRLPDGFHDVSDFIASFPSQNEAKAAIEKLVQQKQSAASSDPPRVAKVERPQTPTTIVEWRQVIAKNFPALARAAEICLSVEAQLLLNDVVNPFGLALVDVPSSGKTITLNFFSEPNELAYTTDNFTAASFVSHATNVRREELGNIDLLPRIRFKTLVVRELNSILGAKEDDLVKSFGILTRVLDGEGLETDSGVHGRRGYTGDYTFMLLAGTTPIQPRVFKVMGNFGSRLFFLSLHTPDNDKNVLIAQNRGRDRKKKEIECRQATENFLRTLWSANLQGVDWSKDNDPDDCLRVVADCACLLASLRGAINVYRLEPADGEEKLSHSVPVIEKADRINCLFGNLTRAHALICGRPQLTEDDLWPVLEITFDSAPPTRAKIFRHLIEKGGRLTTKEIEKLLRCATGTALREMEALSVLGIVDKQGKDEAGRPGASITLTENFAWFTSEECSSLMERRLGYMPEAQLIKEVRSVFPSAAVIA